jgi:hypothetical protein
MHQHDRSNRPHRHTSIVWQSIRTRGLWSGLVLLRLIAREKIRNFLGAHGPLLKRIAMAGLIFGGLWVGTQLIRGTTGPGTGGEVLKDVLLFGSMLALVGAGAAHFVLAPTFRSQVYLRTIYFAGYVLLVSGMAYAFFDTWRRLYTTDAAGATLLGLLAVAAVTGYRDVVGWFLRAVMLHQWAGIHDPTEFGSLSSEQRWGVEVHEAGHAICLGLCSTIPEDAFAFVESDFYQLASGTVNMPMPKNPAGFSKPFTEWMLLTYLTGVAAEREILGMESMTGTGDIEAFNRIAAMYLAAGCGETYILEPTNELDATVNRAAIERLREAKRAKAAEFVALNKASVLRIAEALQEHEFLDAYQLAPLISDVVVPVGWQAVTWPADIKPIEQR